MANLFSKQLLQRVCLVLGMNRTACTYSSQYVHMDNTLVPLYIVCLQRITELL